MKKFGKKLVTGILAASMVLSSVGVSYAMPLWDVATNTGNLGISSDEIGTAKVDFVDSEHGESYTSSVNILPVGGGIWFDSTKSKASLSDIGFSYSYLYIYSDGQVIEYEDGYEDTYKIKKMEFQFDKHYTLYDLYEDSDLGFESTLSISDIINKPHVFAIEVCGNDGSWIEYRFSYYQGFDNMTSKTTSTTSWKSDSNGWWVERSDGSYLKNEWYQSESGLWYYMGADGYMLTNTTTPDGYTVNADGVWVQ